MHTYLFQAKFDKAKFQYQKEIWSEEKRCAGDIFINAAPGKDNAAELLGAVERTDLSSTMRDNKGQKIKPKSFMNQKWKEFSSVTGEEVSIGYLHILAGETLHVPL